MKKTSDLWLRFVKGIIRIDLDKVRSQKSFSAQGLKSVRFCPVQKNVTL